MRRRALIEPSAAACLLLFVLSGCRDAPSPENAATGTSGQPSVEDARAVDEGKPRVLFLGTSLTAGLGLEAREAFPARVAELLAEEGHQIEVVNAGVSGDTSAGGLSRLDWLLRVPPEVVVVELGANDGLRGLPPEMTEENLGEVVERASRAGARVIVAGMLMPPNYGEDYTQAFAAVFPRVARETGSTLIPFLLEGVAGRPELNLADGIHPNAEGHRRIASTVAPHLRAALEALAGPS